MCVTGLSVIDVSKETGVVSQLVLLSLIQIGGLGIMTGMMFMSLVVSRRVGIKGRIFFLGGFGVDGIQGAVKLFFTVIKFTFGLEAIGALIFIAGFLLDGESFGRAAYLAIFHSISSFCNAGFSPCPGGLQGYSTTLIVPGAAMALIILGGIGFPVFAECAARWKDRTFRLSAYAKLVVGMTAGLVFGGALLLLLSDWNGALRGYPVWAKVWNALFMSVTTRTAGYDTVAPGTFSGLGQAVMVVLMLIARVARLDRRRRQDDDLRRPRGRGVERASRTRRLDLHGAQHLAVDGAARALGRRRLLNDDARGHGAADLHGEDALFGAHLRGRLCARHDGAFRRHHAGALHARQAHHNDADVLGTRRPLHIPLHSHSSRRRLRDTLPGDARPDRITKGIQA